MQEHFWSEAGRAAWEDDGRRIFLGRIFIRLGERTYKDAWTGEKTRPSAGQSESLQKVIARAAASKMIRTYVLDPDTLTYRQIPHVEWRNHAALPARFARCQIDADNFKSTKAGGARHGNIYVDAQGLDDLFALVDPTTIISENELLAQGGFVSHYLRFLVHIATAHPLDEEQLPSAKALHALLLREWPTWRAKHSRDGILPKHAVLSSRLLASMSTILRGELKRAQRQGLANLKRT